MEIQGWREAMLARRMSSAMSARDWTPRRTLMEAPFHQAIQILSCSNSTR